MNSLNCRLFAIHLLKNPLNKKEWADSIDGFSSFPDSADKDHDGIVYLLTNAKGKKTAIDAADLKKWVDSYRKGAKEIPITYQRLK